ncbi:MAG: nucleotidyltransferase domain-containing protein [Candidatus Hydrogenedentota bacterium]
MTADVRRTVDECKARLAAHYGVKLRGVVLYGSTARGEDTAESDIDLLVLLEEPFDFFRELDAIIDVLLDVQIQAKRYISARPAEESRYRNGTIQLYRNAMEEGLPL